MFIPFQTKKIRETYLLDKKRETYQQNYATYFEQSQYQEKKTIPDLLTFVFCIKRKTIQMKLTYDICLPKQTPVDVDLFTSFMS